MNKFLIMFTLLFAFFTINGFSSEVKKEDVKHMIMQMQVNGVIDQAEADKHRKHPG